MKVAQFRKVLDQAAQLYRDAGNVDTAESLRELSTLFTGRDAMTVASFAKLAHKVLAASAPE